MIYKINNKEAQLPKITKTPHRYRAFSILKPLEIDSVYNFRWQNRKERPNRFTNNKYMVGKDQRDVSE